MFVVVNAVAGLGPALIGAVGTGVALVGVRLVRRQTAQQAFSGFFALAVAAIVAARTGEARTFFLPGIAVSAACCLAAIASVLLRRPLVGVLAAAFDGSAEWPSQWHRDPVWLRVYSLATLGWALVFGLRVAVQGALYLSDARLGWLAAARLAMGYPGTIVAVMLTVLYLRRPRRSEGVVAE